MATKVPKTKKGLSTALTKATARLSKIAEAAKKRRAARKPKVYSQAAWKGAEPRRLGVYFIRIMSDAKEVGGFGPYATVRAAAADAKNILRLNIGPGHKIIETGPVVPVIRSDERVKLYLHPESYSAQVAGKGIISAQIIEQADHTERLKPGPDDLGTFGVHYNPRRRNGRSERDTLEAEIKALEASLPADAVRAARIECGLSRGPGALTTRYELGHYLTELRREKALNAPKPRRDAYLAKRRPSNQLTRSEFDAKYWGAEAPNVPEGTKREFFSDYRESGLSFAGYKRRTSSPYPNPLVSFKTRSGKTISFDAKRRNPSYAGRLDESKKIVVQGVKGMKSTPFRKTFRNFAAYLKWSDSEEAGNYSVHFVSNE